MAEASFGRLKRVFLAAGPLPLAAAAEPFPLRLLFRLLSASGMRTSESALAAAKAESTSRERRLRPTADSGDGGPLLQEVPRVTGEGGLIEVLACSSAVEAEVALVSIFCTSLLRFSVKSSVKKMP